MSPFTSTPQVIVTRVRQTEVSWQYDTTMTRTDGSRSVAIIEGANGARLVYTSKKFGTMRNNTVTMSGVYEDARQWVESN
jgi:hypothetical protein